MSSDDVTNAVLDTNVWLEWLLFDDPSVAQLRAAHDAARLRILACAQARAELSHVLGRADVLAQAARARARRAGAQAGAIDPREALGRFDAIATIRPLAPDCGLRCSDPQDQLFIDLAAAQSARWLFTRDRALLALARKAAPRFGLAIVAPERFLASPG